MYRTILLVGFVILGTHASSGNSPLILTPYVETGRTDEARNLSLVTDFHPEFRSYSGFITVDKNCDANLYFWFFPSKRNKTTDPVTVWLNGGPGESSLIGLFLENGPFHLTSTSEVKLRKLTWIMYSSVIYVDNPVGTGFSYASRPSECYSKNITHVAKNFLTFLDQFFAIFEEFKSSPFYIFGESYGGKYATGIAYMMLKTNSSLRLDGVGIGNGLIDSATQETYAENLYQLGFADDKMKNHILRKEISFRELLDQKNFAEAHRVRQKILQRHMPQMGFQHWFNYLRSNWNEKSYADIENLLKTNKMKKALHVGNVKRNKYSTVFKMLWQDRMQSVKHWFEFIIERRKTMLYYGQMDLAISYTSSLNLIKSLNWTGAECFRSKSRRIWEVKRKLAGYIKSGGMLIHVLVRNAGHRVPSDQPLWGLNLYNKFIFNKIRDSGIPCPISNVTNK